MDETRVTEKVYCYDHPSAYHNDNALIGAIMSQGKSSDCDNAAMMSMLNSQNNAWNNNPFVYLVWMMMMRWMNGNGWNEGGAENYNSRQIAALQDSVNTNHNNDISLQAINGNTAAINQLAQTFNCDFNTMSQAICGIKSAIEQVSGQVGYSAESVKNAIALGDANIVQQMQQCCCQNKLLVQEMGYKNELANERQTGVLGSKIDAFASQSALSNCQQTNTLERAIETSRQATVNGFAQIGYQMAQDKNDTMRQAEMLNQRVIDTLNNHWQSELQQKYADAKLELSQLNQNATLIAALKTT